MILPDVNLLLYAVDRTSPHHEAASDWWARTLLSPEPIALPWVTSLAFVRLTTNPRIYDRPLTASVALDVVDAWHEHSRVIPVEPTQRHLSIFRELIEEAGTGGNLVTDAHLAALAIEHGATLCSADNDFRRFRGLRWHNPLAG